MKKYLLVFIVSVAVLANSQDALTDKDSVATPNIHLNNAMTAASPDFTGLKSLCIRTPRMLTAEMVQSRPWKMPKLLPAAKVFDNLYFVGNAFSTAWIIKTDEGLILIDALHNEAEAKTSIEAGIIDLGLDPKDIRYLVISHAHGDHYGGVSYIKDKYNPTVIMSVADWKLLEKRKDRIDAPGWDKIPTPDKTIEKREKIILGSTEILLTVTPSHTPGTISTTFKVYDHGTQHKAVLWGGTGFNFKPTLDNYNQYASSAEKMRKTVLHEGIDIFLSNHVARDHSDRKMLELKDRVDVAAPHPFVLGSERTSMAFNVFRECALHQAQVLKSK